MVDFYLLYGTDNSVINNELEKIKNSLNTSDIVNYSLNDTSIKNIIEDVSTISMFSDKKVIVVTEASFFLANKTCDDLDLLENFLKKANNIKNSLIFIVNNEKVDSRKKVYKLIKEKGKIIVCNKGDNRYLINYVEEYLNKANYEMEDINYFLKLVGSNLDNIRNELDKLFMYKLDTKKISNIDIDFVSTKVLEDEIFSLTDAIILGETNRAMELLSLFINNNYDEIYIINLLASQFRFLFQVKLLLNKNKRYDEIANILGVNPYRVKFSINKLYNYSLEDLKRRIKKLALMDKNIKLGMMNKKLALDLFIIDN